jgi:serine/threonine protein kinase
MLFEVRGWQATARLGAGSQGETFLAVDPRAQRKVALKRMRLSAAADWKAVELFEREGELLKRLDHPGIARAVDVFRDGEAGEQAFYIAQEYVPGESLADLLSCGERLREPQLRSFLQQLGEILDHIHGRNPPILHRDIKPSNLMLRTGRVEAGKVEASRYVLIDFGAGQFAAPTLDQEGGSTIVGTSGYMPPEQLLGRTSPASDLYALGATAIHLATGVHPSDMGLARLRLDWRPHVKPGFEISTALGQVLDALVAPAVEDRISTAGVLLERLGRAGASVGSPGGSPTRRTANLRALGVSLGLVATAGVIIGVVSESRPPPPPPETLDIVPDHLAGQSPEAPAAATSTKRAAEAWTLPAEVAFPTTIPVSVELEPNLALTMGPEKAQALVASLVVSPRALESEPYAWRFRGLLTYSGSTPIAELGTVWRVFDASGHILASISEDLVPSFAAPLRGGDLIGFGVSGYPKEGAWEAVRIVGQVSRVDFAEPEEAPPDNPQPRTVVWSQPIPSGVDLRLRQLSDDSEPKLDFADYLVRRLRFEVTQAGTATIRDFTLLARHVDPKGQVAPKTETLRAVAGASDPSLQPGERRIFSLYEQVHPALTSLELEVTEVDAWSPPAE